MAPSGFKLPDLITKLDTLTNTQESIQKTSLWIIHHKNHAEDVVKQWTKSYCEASSQRQLVLFYLANDVIQNSKKKSFPGYVEGFKSSLKDACKETDDGEIFTNLSRVLQIWQERGVYEREFIDELRELLYGEHLRMELTAKIVNEFQPKELIALSSEVDKLAQIVKTKQQLFNSCKIDVSNPDLNRLKDKKYGKHYQDDFDSASKCLKNVLDARKNHSEKFSQFIEMLEKAKIYYSVQWKELLELSDKFQAFEERTSQVHQHVLDRAAGAPPSNSFNTFSPGKLNNLLASVIGGGRSSSNSLENRISNIFSGNQNNNSSSNNHKETISGDYWNESGYNPYNTTVNSSLDAENIESADMDIETSDDEGTKKHFMGAIPPPPKEPKLQDFLPKNSPYNVVLSPQGSNRTLPPPPPLPVGIPHGHGPPPYGASPSYHHRGPQSVVVPLPPPPPPPQNSHHHHSQHHHVQPLPPPPPPAPHSHSNIAQHHSSSSYGHNDYKDRGRDDRGSSGKRHSYHHHHDSPHHPQHQDDRNWKRRKGYNY